MSTPGFAGTTCDAMLGGRLTIEQPSVGFRAGTDAVLLAASVPAKAGETALDLGCGVGTAALCLMRRTGAVCTGVEVQPDYAALAHENGGRNGLPLEVVEADVLNLPAPFRQRTFHHVFCNPPYFGAGQGTGSANAGRETALRDDGSLGEWLGVAVRRTRPKGTTTFIARTDRLADLMAALPKSLGSLRIAPLAAREDRPAKRFILQGIVDGRAPLVLLPPVVLHEGAVHEFDGENESRLARKVLRDGAALPLSGRGM